MNGPARDLPRLEPAVRRLRVAPSLQVGNPLPPFTLTDQSGTEHHSNQLGGQPLVLFFYPKDDTPGCTAEVCAFRDDISAFEALGAHVWGVSGDDASSHGRFAQRHSLPFPLLVDQGNSVRKALGVPGVLGLIPGRVTYVVDGSGVVRFVFNNLLDGAAHAREALAALRRLAV